MGKMETKYLGKVDVVGTLDAQAIPYEKGGVPCGVWVIKYEWQNSLSGRAKYKGKMELEWHGKKNTGDALG
jgi:hypothetical protein